MRKSKAYVLLSVIVAAAVLGVLVFSAYASENAATEEEEKAPSFFWGFRNRWLDILTDEQLATLGQLIEENRAKVRNQLEDWGVEVFELDDQQREQLKAIIKENRVEVKELLESWGEETPMRRDPMGWLGSLTDDQKEELQTMRQEYEDAVRAKMEEWGIETPEVNGPPLGGLGFRRGGLGGMRCRTGGFRGLGIFKP